MSYFFVSQFCGYVFLADNMFETKKALVLEKPRIAQFVQHPTNLAN